MVERFPSRLGVAYRLQAPRVLMSHHSSEPPRPPSDPALRTVLDDEAPPSSRDSRSPTSYRMIFEQRDPESRRSRRLSTPPPPPVDPEATVVQPRPGSEQPPPTSPRAYRPGDVLAHRYRLIGPLGEGGMGSVWRAHSLGLDVDVALKLIRPETKMARAEERLQKEARAAARVAHPAAVRVFDYLLTEAGDPFLVMELLEGTSLAQRLAEAGPLSPVEAVRTILPIVGALDAAHREGIVHRDVKPANIMLVASGDRTIPKLIDFGIVGVARVAGERKLTSRGMMLGSPVYVAPEQVRSDGGDPDERTDVWGVCVTLYELLTGDKAFAATSRRDAAARILHERLACPPELDREPALWGILDRGLAKRPGDRWSSMKELGRVLAAWGIQRGVISDAAGASLADTWLSGPA